MLLFRKFLNLTVFLKCDIIQNNVSYLLDIMNLPTILFNKLIILFSIYNILFKNPSFLLKNIEIYLFPKSTSRLHLQSY